MAKERISYEKDICFDIILEEEDFPQYDVLVAGFPGTGLIGGIASEQLINTLELEQVASVDCPEFPPTAVIFEGIPRRPVRFFAGDEFLLVKSDMIIPPNLADSLAEAIIDFGLDSGVNEVIIFDAIPENDSDGEEKEEKKVWGVLSCHDARSIAEDLDIEVISRGAVSGISSSLLLHANEKKAKGIGMFVEGNPQMPDPKASAVLLEKFSEHENIDIETSSLIKMAEELEEQYAQMVEKAKQAQNDMERDSAYPPLYG